AIQDRTKRLMDRAEDANLALIEEIQKAMQASTSPGELDAARNFHRRAQWRLDFVSAENSMGFHASQEVARILGEAIDLARQGQIEAIRVQTGHSPAQPETEKKELAADGRRESDADSQRQTTEKPERGVPPPDEEGKSK